MTRNGRRQIVEWRSLPTAGHTELLERIFENVQGGIQGRIRLAEGIFNSVRDWPHASGKHHTRPKMRMTYRISANCDHKIREYDRKCGSVEQSAGC